ncbi:MAG: hypothetical protein IBX56_07850 [Methylomicrobium sp.]|nr:hypothetical protein [Methylomicrobium sp.]
MSDLIEKLRKARQSNVTIENHRFTIRRPTPMEALEWLGQIDAETTQRWFDEHFSLALPSWRPAAIYAIRHFVDGWDAKEIDLIPGGTAVDVPFDVDLCLEWIQDHPQILNGIAVAIFEAWLNYLQNREADEKKLKSGSTTEP